MKKKPSKKITRPKAGWRAALAGATGSIHLLDFNINDNVRVRLTDYGRDILRKNHDELEKSWGGRLPYDFRLPSEDKAGWSTWQMWHLMESFGAHIHLGCKNPFDLNIRIETKRSNS